MEDAQTYFRWAKRLAFTSTLLFAVAVCLYVFSKLAPEHSAVTYSEILELAMFLFFYYQLVLPVFHAKVDTTTHPISPVRFTFVILVLGGACVGARLMCISWVGHNSAPSILTHCPICLV